MAMQSPAEIEATDVDAVARLLGGLPLQPREVQTQKRYVVEGLARIVQADSWIWVLQNLEAATLSPAYYAIIDGGWRSDEERDRCILGTFSREAAVVLRPLAVRISEHCTYTRSDAIGDADWYRSEFYLNHRQPIDLDDCLLSFYPIDQGIQSAIRMHRHRGRSAFAARERHILHAVTGALDWLHRAELPDTGLPSLADLTRRARQVLLLLLQGDSKKQVAYKLGITEHTVCDYVKDLHRRFQVHSRGELLSRFIPHALLPPDQDDRAA